jgi:hypothetical protein
VNSEALDLIQTADREVPSMAKAGVEKRAKPDKLKGWRQIATFLGEPVSVVQRWGVEGMPVHREGRSVTTSADELNLWLGQQSGKPVHAATESTDLSAELKRGLAFVRGEKRTAGGKSSKLSS